MSQTPSKFRNSYQEHLPKHDPEKRVYLGKDGDWTKPLSWCNYGVYQPEEPVNENQSSPHCRP